MASKSVRNLPITDPATATETYVPVGTASGGSGPVLCVIGGVHGSEYAAHDAVLEFWRRIDPERLNGEVRVVLAADVTAMVAHSAYVNPVDGKNLNRVLAGQPGGHADGTHRPRHHDELRRRERCGHRRPRRRVGRGHRLLHHHPPRRRCRSGQAHGGAGDGPRVHLRRGHRLRDGPILGTGTGSGEAMKGGRPAMTLEAGGAGGRQRRFVMAHVHALENALRHLGIVDGEPLRFDGASVLLDHGILIKTTVEGMYRPAVEIGDWIEAGGLFAEVLDLEGNVLEEIRVPEAGTVLDVIIARTIKAGGFGGKIGVL